MFGCGLTTRRVCVFRLSSMARTIGDENKIGRSRMTRPFVWACAAVEQFPEIAVSAQKLIAILRPSGFLEVSKELGAGAMDLPIKVSIVLDVVELQEFRLDLSAAGATAALSLDHFAAQRSSVFGRPLPIGR